MLKSAHKLRVVCKTEANSECNIEKIKLHASPV